MIQIRLLDHTSKFNRYEGMYTPCLSLEIWDLCTSKSEHIWHLNLPIMKYETYWCRYPTVPLHYYCQVGLVILWPLRLLYIERRFCHLNHLSIFHLCNIKEVSPSKRLISKVLIYLFYLFVSWFHNIWYQSFGFQGFVAPNKSTWNFHYNFFSVTLQKLQKKKHLSQNHSKLWG